MRAGIRDALGSLNAFAEAALRQEFNRSQTGGKQV